MRAGSCDQTTGAYDTSPMSQAAAPHWLSRSHWMATTTKLGRFWPAPAPDSHWVGGTETQRPDLPRCSHVMATRRQGDGVASALHTPSTGRPHRVHRENEPATIGSAPRGLSPQDVVVFA